MDDETEVHEMDGYREGQVTIWTCPVAGCGHKIAFFGGISIVMEQGNWTINHVGRNVFGLIDGVVSVLPPSPFPPSPFEEWMEGTDIEALFGDHPIP